MQLKKLEIYGYGKWVDQSFDLTEGLQVFLGDNEAGKSTLMSFIHSILFGFPTRNSTFLRYEPHESSKYGGRIFAADNILGEIIIERVHGKVTGNVTVTLEDGTTGSDELLESLLKGLSRENFQSIFSFSLSDIENVHQLDKNKLSRYLLNIGAHSTDYYLDLVDDFQKNAYDLYRPSGRIPPLNRELTEISEQENKLEKLEKRNKSYLDLIKKYNEQNEVLRKMQEQEKKLQDQLKDLKEFKKELHVLREIQTLKKEITETQLPILKKDGPYLFEEYKKETIQIKELLENLKTKIALEKETFLKPELIENYQENKKEIIRLEQELPEIIEEVGQLETIENQINNHQRTILELNKSLKIERKRVLPTLFSDEERGEIVEFKHSHDHLATEMVGLTSEIQDLEYKINLKNQKADHYEEMMWDSHYFKEIENQIKINDRSKSEKVKPESKLISLGVGVLGIIVLLSSFFMSSSNQWLIVGMGSFILFLSFLLYRRSSKKELKEPIESEASKKMLVNEYEKQLGIQTDWQTLLGEIDAIQQRYQAKVSARTAIIKEQEYLVKKWMTLLTSHHLPTVHLIEDAEKVIGQTAELQQLEKITKELADAKNRITEKLENQLTVMDDILFLNQELSLLEKTNYFRVYLKELNEILQTEQLKIEQLQSFETKKRQLSERLKLIENKVNHLLETSGVQSEDEFLELYKKKENLDQKKSRVEFLEENTPSFDSKKPLPSKEELLDKEEKIHLKLEEQQKQSQEIVNQRANTQVNIENLEKDGSYSEALQDFENKKASVQNLVDEWISDKMAAVIIQSTLNQVTKERFEEIIAEINRYFCFLTDGDYTNIRFKDEELLAQTKDGSLMEVKVLSRGTAEPLYVAIRLAYIVKMQDIIKLPIIIDDPFVNFDHQRKKNVYRLLDKLSDKLQIIYFSFDPELKNEFNESQIIDLE